MAAKMNPVCRRNEIGVEIFGVAVAGYDFQARIEGIVHLLNEIRHKQVIRIENDNPQSAYAKSFHALVFEFADLLWFYCDMNGTQSLSLERGRLREEKADLSPLLKAIDPGFTHWKVVKGSGGSAGDRLLLPNACFIECVATWKRLAAEGTGVDEATLLSFYGEPRKGASGHTVLAFKDGDYVRVVDPRERSVTDFPATVGKDPLTLAKALAGNIVKRARFFPIDRSQRIAGGWTATGKPLDVYPA
jgi:hypothetical protein